MPFADRRSLGLIHIAALAVVIGFSIHAVRGRPETRLVGQAKVNAGTTLTATRLDRTYRAWDMDLRIDGTVKPPGWSWILHEGKHPGTGYELHWLADQQVLQVRRTGQEAFLLGSAHLGNPPAQISFQRRGGLLIAQVDDQPVLRCLDPDNPRNDGTRDWGCTTAGTLGEATLTVQTLDDDPTHRGAVRSIAAEPPFRAVAAACRASGSNEEIALIFGRASEQLGTQRNVPDQPTGFNGFSGRVLDPLLDPQGFLRTAHDTQQPGRSLTPSDRARLRIWLALGRIRWQLATGDEGDSDGFASVSEQIENLFTATDDDQTLRTGAPAPEIAGILMSLTRPLASRAVTIPPPPPRKVGKTTRSDESDESDERQNALIIAHRARWLKLLARVTSRTLKIAGSSLAPDDARQLELLLHIVGCMRQTDSVAAENDAESFGPLPTPIDGPAWQTGLWRAFAGGAPGVDIFPPLGGSSGPVTAAIELLRDDFDLDPVPALRLRYQVATAMANRDRLLSAGREAEGQRRRFEDEALSACTDLSIPERERILTQALIALHLAGSRVELLRQARIQLISSNLVLSDPLAFALDQLIVRRHAALLALRPEETPPLPDKVSINRYFPEYQVLLEGKPAAVAPIWRVRLPHAQALAVALIMREVTDGQPDWPLLERVPGFTLPLRLLPPVGAPSASSGGAVIAPGPGIAP
jgi:hypothetical protein